MNRITAQQAAKLRAAKLRNQGLFLIGLMACALAVGSGCAERGQDKVPTTTDTTTGTSAAAESLQQGLAFLASGNYDQAVARFSGVIESDPRNVEALKHRAVAYSRRGQVLAAETDLSRAIQVQPESPELYVQRANLWLALRRYDAAMDDCRIAISLDKEDAGAPYAVLARVHLALGRYEEAVRACNEVLRLHPDTAQQVLNNRGLAYTNLGQYQKAIEDFTSSLQRNRNQFMPLNNRGIVYQMLDDNERAMADFTKAIDVAPREPMAYTNRGPLYLKLGDPDRAIADLTLAIKIIRKPDIQPTAKVAVVYCNRGEAYLQKKELDLALADCKEALSIDPQSEQGQLLWRQIYEARGDPAEAEAALEQWRKTAAQ